MISIDIFLNKQEIIEEIIVKGHSGFDKKGRDIVCSAVSVLVQTAFLSLSALFKDYSSEDYVKMISIKDFNFKITEFPEKLTGELKGVTLFLIVGLSEIVKIYNKFVKLEIIRR